MSFLVSDFIKFLGLLCFSILFALIIAFLSYATFGEISQTLATLLVGFAASVVVGWQINSASNQAKRDHETELKLNLYKEIANKVRLSIDPFIVLGFVHREYANEIVLNEQTQGRFIPAAGYDSISEKWKRKCSAVSEIKGVIEDWIVVDARLDLFELAISSADYEVERQYKLYLDEAMESLPRLVRNPEGKYIASWTPPDVNTQSKLAVIGGQLHSDCLTLLTYVLDFRDQMQMSLLKGLFPDSRIAPRLPKDPKFIVLDIEKADDQKRYFMTQTDFGKLLSKQ